jgi:hypothetical protein
LENPRIGVSNSAQKIDGLSNSGQQKKSMLPLSFTSAALRMSPMMPWHRWRFVARSSNQPSSRNSR